MTKIKIDRDWCIAAAEREGDSEVGAGMLARDPEPCPTCKSWHRESVPKYLLAKGEAPCPDPWHQF